MITVSDKQEDGAKQKSAKQAVVIIHGMGEQRPMETLRSFVETVFQRDSSLRIRGKTALVDNDPDLGEVNRVWIVPDKSAGSMELRRITTSPHKGNYRTDFFEFYWADVMDSNPLDLVVGWLRGLLLRPPWRVPGHVFLHWIIAWVFTLVGAYFAWAVAMPDERFANIARRIGQTLRQWLCDPSPFASLATGVLGNFGLTLPPGYAAGGLVSGIALTLIGLAWGLFNNREGVKAATARSIGPFLVLLLGISILVILVPPWATSARLWAAIFTGVSGAIVSGFAVPYLGDVTRYVRATPSTVAKRKEIRERGLALLRAVHGIGPGGKGKNYERVILVAHSLGTIIAYDLLMLFWEEIGPNHDRASPHPEVEAALKDFDRTYVQTTWPTEFGNPNPMSDEEKNKLQSAQTGVFDALRRTRQGWLISDFVTMGSPLTHADFLMSDDRFELRNNFRDRAMASAPPRPDWPKKEDPKDKNKKLNSMLYYVDGRGPFAHFAAPFCAVRWTNFYDNSWFPLLGDFVSGRMPRPFGPGIKERRVKMKRSGVPILGRLVTHTLYWQWMERFAKKTPDHITWLREALRLDYRPDA
jgi:hypothetical protein